MNEFVKMDVFFVIASTATIFLTILLVILLVYLIKFSKNLKDISVIMKTEAGKLNEDIENLRGNLRSTGFKLKHVFNFFKSIINSKKGK